MLGVGNSFVIGFLDFIVGWKWVVYVGGYDVGYEVGYDFDRDYGY